MADFHGAQFYPYIIDVLLYYSTLCASENRIKAQRLSSDLKISIYTEKIPRLIHAQQYVGDKHVLKPVFGKSNML